MTEKELRKLKRSDLLEIMMEQAEEIEKQREELEKAREQLRERKLKLETSGSIAEASLAINNVIESAQTAADEYLASIRENQAASEREMEQAQKQAEEMIREARERAEEIEAEAKLRMEEMVSEGIERRMKEREEPEPKKSGIRERIREWRRNK